MSIGSFRCSCLALLVAGTFFRRSRVGRFVHSYNQNGTVAAAMQERPRDVFDRVFIGLALEMLEEG